MDGCFIPSVELIELFCLTDNFVIKLFSRFFAFMKVIVRKLNYWLSFLSNSNLNVWLISTVHTVNALELFCITVNFVITLFLKFFAVWSRHFRSHWSVYFNQFLSSWTTSDLMWILWNCFVQKFIVKWKQCPRDEWFDSISF